MNKYLISVIIPTFGRPAGLKAAIDSVLKQTYKPIEIIVVDDNAPDSKYRVETEAVMREFFLVHEINYAQRSVNGGGALARNTGVEMAKGDLITFLDDDDEYLPEKIEKQVNQFVNQNIELSLCGMRAKNNGRPLKYIKGIPVGRNLKEMTLYGNVLTPMIMVTRDLLNAVGGFTNTPRFQDHLLMLKLLKKTDKVGIIEEGLYIHNIHPFERISFSKNSRVGYIKKQEVENENRNILSKKEQQDLDVRQRQEILRCDLEEGTILGRVRLIVNLIASEKSFRGVRSNTVFAAKYVLSKFSIVHFVRNNIIWKTE